MFARSTSFLSPCHFRNSRIVSHNRSIRNATTNTSASTNKISINRVCEFIDCLLCSVASITDAAHISVMDLYRINVDDNIQDDSHFLNALIAQEKRTKEIVGTLRVNKRPVNPTTYETSP